MIARTELVKHGKAHTGVQQQCSLRARVCSSGLNVKAPFPSVWGSQIFLEIQPMCALFYIISGHLSHRLT